MTDEHKNLIKVLGIVGLLLIFAAPYIPSLFFALLSNIYDYRYTDIRMNEIIPSIRMCGIILSVWAMVLFVKLHKK